MKFTSSLEITFSIEGIPLEKIIVNEIQNPLRENIRIGWALANLEIMGCQTPRISPNIIVVSLPNLQLDAFTQKLSSSLNILSNPQTIIISLIVKITIMEVEGFEKMSP